MPRAVSARQRSSSRFIARVLPGAKPVPFPAFIEPCLATLRSKVPSARGFVHELKLDGYRVQAHLPTVAYLCTRAPVSTGRPDSRLSLPTWHACQRVSSSPYRSGRSQQWFKVKSWKRERFAVVGFVPEDSHGLLKLRLARQEGGALIYVGRVGTGWDRETARE